MTGTGLERTTINLHGAGGVPLVAWRWRDPAVAGKATVVLVHGYAEHLGRYEHVIEALIRGGYDVVGMDDRGHGHSGGRRAAVRDFDAFVDDLDLLIDTKAHGYGPVYLLGHSMGGLIATRCALRRNDLAGLIVSGAAYKVWANLSGWQRRASALMARWLPNLPWCRPASRASSLAIRTWIAGSPPTRSRTTAGFGWAWPTACSPPVRTREPEQPA